MSGRVRSEERDKAAEARRAACAPPSDALPWEAPPQQSSMEGFEFNDLFHQLNRTYHSASLNMVNAEGSLNIGRTNNVVVSGKMESVQVATAASACASTVSAEAPAVERRSTLPKRSAAVPRKPAKPLEPDFLLPKATGRPLKVTTSAAPTRPLVATRPKRKEDAKELEAAAAVAGFVGDINMEACLFSGSASASQVAVYAAPKTRECSIVLERCDDAPPASFPTDLPNVCVLGPKTRECSVVLDRCDAATSKVDLLGDDLRLSDDEARPNASSLAKKVKLAASYGFGVSNRTCVIQNVAIMCPYDGEIRANWDHVNAHTDIDKKKLKAYAQGLYSSNMRGPYHKETLVDTLYNAAQNSRQDFEKELENFLLNAGVGTTENKKSSVQIYDMKKVFEIGYQVPVTHEMLVDQQADLELDEV